jgi:predicted branched-subunit amino acid permease
MPMPKPNVRRAFWQGFRDGAPFLLVVVPFGMLFGALAAEAGWNIAEIMAASILIIAGASQFTMLQLMSENAPTLIVIGTALAVNLRMAMYSAALAPHIGAAPLWQRALAAYFLTDQTYGAAVNRYALQPRMSGALKIAHFFGAAAPVCGPWYLATWAGAVAGAAIPAGMAIDFAVPVTFIALFAPALRTLPHLAAALVSVAAALIFAGLPCSTGVRVAAGLARVTGAEVERWQERRA